MAGRLHPVQHHDLDQRARMQARCGWIEADIGCHSFLGEEVVEAGFIGNLMNEAALLQRAQEIGFEFSHDLGLSMPQRLRMRRSRCC